MLSRRIISLGKESQSLSSPGNRGQRESLLRSGAVSVERFDRVRKLSGRLGRHTRLQQLAWLLLSFF